MNLKIVQVMTIPEIPSASGIVFWNNHYFIIGDDSPFLFELNSNFEVLRKIQIFSTDKLVGQRIPKAKKPDFEALEIVEDRELIIFGSGSTEKHRNSLIRVALETMEVTYYDISKLYEEIKSLPQMQDSELNIEATCYADGDLYLFNRSNNLLLVFEWNAFISFIEAKTAFQNPVVHSFTLPKIDNLESKFSGACALTNSTKILFSSSVENTSNSYDDGEILGSFVGVIDLSSSSSIPMACVLLPHVDTAFKVESLALTHHAEHNAELVIVTDADGGDSKLIKVKVALTEHEV